MSSNKNWSNILNSNYFRENVNMLLKDNNMSTFEAISYVMFLINTTEQTRCDFYTITALQESMDALDLTPKSIKEREFVLTPEMCETIKSTQRFKNRLIQLINEGFSEKEATQILFDNVKMLDSEKKCYDLV